MKSYDKFDVDGRVIIITGGSGLIGKEYVRVLTELGAKVVICDIDEAAATALAKKVGTDKVLFVKTDISDKASVEAMVQQTIDTFGKIDGLVNNAALDPKFDPEHAAKHTLTFENFPLEMWQQALDVNMTGMFLCSQAVAPHMLKQGKGSVVNVSSTYGMCGPDQRLYIKDDPDAPVSIKPVTYTVTKSAVFGLTKYLATYWGDKGIRVNTLTIGGVFNNHEDEFVRRYSYKTPLGRMAQADEYCGALVYLLSDASSYMTGSNFVIDGGWTAW